MTVASVPSLMGVFPFLSSSVTASLVFALYFLPPGWVLGSITNVAEFRFRSLAEKLLWSVALSYPIGSIIGVLLGHYVGPNSANVIFGILLLFGIWLFWKQRTGPVQIGLGPTWKSLVACLLSVVALSFFATAAIRVRGHLEEPVCSNDWYIRLPVQWAAAHGGVPPTNPLFTLFGHNPTLTYYYYYYVFCSAPMRLAHLSARAAMTAGVVWAGLAFFSTAWLLVKYLLQPSQADLFNAPGKTFTTRKLALGFFFVSLITGLDLLVVLRGLVSRAPYPTVWWWSIYGVYSWAGALPFIPHHFLGMSSGLLGYLLLTMGGTRRSQLVCAAVAGICFASLLGTSTFLAITVYCCAAAWGGFALWHKNWVKVYCVGLSLFLVPLLNLFYIADTFFVARDLTATQSVRSSGGRHFVISFLHEEHAKWLVESHWRTVASHLAHSHFPQLPVVLLVTVTLYLVHYGFYLFVLWYKGRQLLHRRSSNTAQESALWCFFLVSTALATFVSSAPMQAGLNDFGRLSTQIARVILILWATPLVLSAWERWRHGPPLPVLRKGAFMVAGALAVVGLAGTAEDVLMQRAYLPLVDFGKIVSKIPFDWPPGIGMVDAELQQAWTVIGERTPQNAVVQANPNGEMQRPVLLYLNRRVAAGDVSCETSFGGDVNSCSQKIVRPLLALYGQGADQKWLRVTADETPEHFLETCRSIGLSALIVDAYDPAWKQSASWVWNEPTLYASEHVRVVLCPGSVRPSL